MYIKILEKETIKLYGRKWKKEMEGGRREGKCNYMELNNTSFH